VAAPVAAVIGESAAEDSVSFGAGEFAGLERAARADAAMPPAAALPPPERELQQIHFLFDSDTLTPGGWRKVVLAAREIVGQPPSRLRIVGYSDRLGDPAYNPQHSYRRAHSVAESLIQAGVPRDLVAVIGQGEDTLPEPTDNGVGEPLNRSVAIVAVP
jgi:outer membrane protein OmpA-like peptidoglycan-associated protein